MNGYQFIIAVVASCGGLLFGYEIGMMNVILVMDAFRIYFGLYTLDDKITNEKGDGISEENIIDKTSLYHKLIEKDSKPYVEGFITSSFIFGAIFGAVLSSVLTKKFSIQKIVMISAVIFALGSFIQGSSKPTIILLSLGRIISGLAVGCISVLCPAYVNEVAPTRIRNSIISCYEMMMAIGIIVATINNSLIWYKTNAQSSNVIQDGKEYNKEWRLAFYLQLIPSFLMFILLLFIPNSSEWLHTKVRDDEDPEVLDKLISTSSTDPLVQEESKVLLDDDTFTNTLKTSSYKELFDKKHRRHTFITFIMQFFQQWTGIQSILYYQTQFFSSIGFSQIISTITLPVINNSIYFVSTLIGIWKVKKIGRKSLIITSSILLLILGMGISISSQHAIDPMKDVLSNFRKYIFVGCIFLFTFIYACLWGPIPKVYQTENFSLPIRMKGTTFSIINHFISSGLVVFFTPILIHYWGMNVFLLFTASCYLAVIFSIFCYIESKGTRLENIDENIDEKIIVKIQVN